MHKMSVNNRLHSNRAANTGNELHTCSISERVTINRLSFLTLRLR
jgi:hypothetical protein